MSTPDYSHLDEPIYSLAEQLETPEGLHYTLSKLVSICWLDSSGEYDTLASLIGTLESVKAELYLRTTTRGGPVDGDVFPN